VRAKLTIIAACAALCVAGSALAADEAAVLRLRADQLASQDRCEEALARLLRARELAPDDAHSALVAGRCFLRLNRYEEAVSFLEQARRMDPNARGIDIDLAMAQFHRADYAAAERDLAGAEQEMPNDPRVSLYRGLLLLQQAEDAEGARALERAGRLDQDIDPLASYYAGLAWERARERERAEQALRRVQQEAPGSDWAQQATLAMHRLGEPYRRHWWSEATAGLAYDSNAVLLGDGVVLPADISNKADGLGTFSLEGGRELLRNPDWSAGAIAGYDGSAYFNLDGFDLQYPTLAGWLDRRVDDVSFVRLQPFGGYAWRDTDRYMGAAGGDLSYYRRYKRSSARAYAQIVYTDYLFDIPIDSEILGILATPGNIVPQSVLLAANDRLARWRNRDGVLYVGGYEQLLEVRDGTRLRVGVDYQRYQSAGIEYTHDHFGIWLGARQQLPWRVDLDVVGSFAYEPYEHPSTFVNSATKGLFPSLVDAGPRRRDKVWTVKLMLERPVTDWLKASVRWQYQNNDSNTAVFKYDRHIVGGFLTVAFGG
jgi:tetratricopeptide (TPR) repeat protein